MLKVCKAFKGVFLCDAVYIIALNDAMSATYFSYRQRRLSVRPSSVCQAHAGTFGEKNYRRITRFTPPANPGTLAFLDQLSHLDPRETQLATTSNENLVGKNDEKRRVLTNKSLYLGNDERQANRYNGRLITKRVRAFHWYQFRRPSTTVQH